MFMNNVTSFLQVRGYPTIKMFPAGKKDGDAMEYDGGRTSSDIVNWATEKLAQNLPPPEVVQVYTTNIKKIFGKTSLWFTR